MSLTKKWGGAKVKHTSLPHPHNTSHIEINFPIESYYTTHTGRPIFAINL